MRLPVMLIVSIFSAALALRAQSPRPSSATGLIVGIVVDAATGKPVGGATVSISSGVPAMPMAREAPATLPRILTSADGRFVYRDLRAGNYTITATKPGYAQGAYGRRRPAGPFMWLDLAEGERTADVVVRVWKHAAISGAVIDEAGEPVVGARVRSWRRTFEGGRYALVASGAAFTDDRGIYRIGGLVPGEYAVGMLGTQVAGGEQPPAQGRTLSPNFGAAGVVRTAPVPPPPVDGRLFLYPSTWHPSASSSAQAMGVSIVSGQERGGIDLQMHPAPSARVSGTITRADGRIGGVPVRLVPAGDETIEDAGFITGADGNGSFVFPAVPAGQYSVRIAATLSTDEKQTLMTTLWAETPVTVGDSNIDDVALAVGHGIRITGRLQFEGSKPGPARVDRVPLLVESVDRRFTFPSGGVTVDPGGQFSTGGYPPGRYFVRVSGSPIGWMFKSATYGGRDVSETPIDLVSEDVHVVLTYTDRWTALAGTVNTPDGAVATDAIVLMFPTDPTLWANYGTTPRRIKSGRTRKSGEFTVNSLPPGAYYVVAVPDSQAVDWMDPAFLAAVSRVATQISIGEGEQKTMHLRTQVIR
jgi:hypothetical protein